MTGQSSSLPECLISSCHCSVDISFVSFLDFGDHLFGGRVHGLERLAGSRCLELIVDENLRKKKSLFSLKTFGIARDEASSFDQKKKTKSEL